MQRSNIHIFGLAFVASLAPAVSAQEMPANEAQIELAGYADCVVSKKGFKKPVDAFLRTIPDSAAFFSAGMKAADMTCLNAAAVRRRAAKLEMKLQPATFREALYPALYRREFGNSGVPVGIENLEPLTLASEFDGNVSTLPSTYRPGRALGDCVARKAPQQSHVMLMTKLFSLEEKTAVETLKPSLAFCLSEGQTVRFTRLSLRAYLGEALYKLAIKARPA
jgi:hypothetical protein